VMMLRRRLFGLIQRIDHRDGLPSGRVELSSLLLLSISMLMGHEVAEERKLSIGVLRYPASMPSNAI